MRTRFYFRYYAHSILFRNRYRKEHNFKDINDTVFCMHGNWKYGINFTHSKRYTENLSENSKQKLELLYQKAEVERLTKIAEWNENYNEIIHNTSHYLKVIGQLAYEGRNDEICKVVDELNGKLNRKKFVNTAIIKC